MGANLCGCRTFPKEDDSIDKSMTSVAAETNNCFKTCSKKREKIESMNHQTNKWVMTKKRTFTLEDWLLASPGLKPDHFNRGSGELHVYRQHYRSRVHPSSATNTIVSNSNVIVSEASNEMVNFKVDRVLEEEDQLVNVVGSSSLNRRQSGKIKKKVSFKMPQESDVIIFHSPD